MSLVRRRLIGLAIGVACLLAVATGAALWNKHDLLQADADADAAKLLGWRSADVTGLVLENLNGRFVLERQGTTWALREPMATGADASTIDAIVSAVADLSRTQKVEIDGKPPTELGLFGLAPPRAAVTLQRASDAKTIDVGKANALTGDVYARVHDSDNVVMVGRAIEYQVEKTLFDLREKRLVVFNPSDVERVDVTGSTSYSIAQSRVTLADGTSFEGDTTQISAIESALANLRAMKFVDAAPVTAKTTRARVTLSGGVTHTFVLGEDKDGHWFGWLDDEKGPIAEVSGDWVVRKLDVDPKTLRDMRIMHFTREDVGRVSVKRDADAVTLTMNEAGVWRVGDKEADGSRVSGLLYALFGLRAESMLFDHAGDAELTAEGFAEPALVIELAKRDGSAIATLLVAKDKDGRTVATAQGSGQIAIVESTQIDDISAKTADYLPSEAQATK